MILSVHVESNFSFSRRRRDVLLKEGKLDDVYHNYQIERIQALLYNP